MLQDFLEEDDQRYLSNGGAKGRLMFKNPSGHLMAGPQFDRSCQTRPLPCVSDSAEMT